MVRKEMAGKKMDEFEFPVERGKIKEFASAICDPNPIYRDRAYAKSQGFDDVIAPVTFPVAASFHMPYDNYVLETSLKLGMDPGKSVHGTFEIIYQRPVCAGETLRGEVVIGDIYEKEGKRGGKMTFVDMKQNFYDENNKLVITISNVFIERA
ncbi:MAG: MaoC family dehydratase N-terminal domain-containing protein [Syntrophales bacterium]|jgi:acyl dehydratase